MRHTSSSLPEAPAADGFAVHTAGAFLLRNAFSMLLLLISILFITISVILSDHSDMTLSTILQSLGIALAAIIIIELSWRQVGGSPLEQQLSRFETSTSHALNNLHQATATLSDLQATGITRLYSTRAVRRDERLTHWSQLLATAKHVDLMAFTLWTEWFQYSILIEKMKDVITKNNGSVRIVILDRNDDPCSSFAVRWNQPGEHRSHETLPKYLELTHEQLPRIERDLQTLPGFETRFVHDTIISALIVRIDDYMFVSPYFTSTLGEESFAFELTEPHSNLFQEYMKEFETIFTSP